MIPGIWLAWRFAAAAANPANASITVHANKRTTAIVWSCKRMENRQCWSGCLWHWFDWSILGVGVLLLSLTCSIELLPEGKLPTAIDPSINSALFCFCILASLSTTSVLWLLHVNGTDVSIRPVNIFYLPNTTQTLAMGYCRWRQQHRKWDIVFPQRCCVSVYITNSF